MLGVMRYVAVFTTYSYTQDDLGVAMKSSPVSINRFVGKNDRFNSERYNSGSPQGGNSIEIFGYKNDLVTVKQNDKCVIDGVTYKVNAKRFEFPDKTYLILSTTDASEY